MHLLSNAAKFTSKNGRIDVIAKVMAGGGLALIIRDTGIGMASSLIRGALEPFKQLDAGLERRFEGLGLGLPLANALMRLHGGSLAIHSEPGHGTTVNLDFPPERTVPRPRRLRHKRFPPKCPAAHVQDGGEAARRFGAENATNQSVRSRTRSPCAKPSSMTATDRSSLVLFSGGQDSTTILAWALDRFDLVETVGFSYGQRHAAELDARPRILERLKRDFRAVARPARSGSRSEPRCASRRSAARR